MIRIGLLGASGRMGHEVTELLKTEFKGKAELAASASQGEPVDSLLDTDVVIDFSLPEGMGQLAKAALARTDAKKLPAFVVGSTGWKIDERRVLEELAKKAPVLISTNFSTGVQALITILKQAAPMLEKLGYTPVIVESHHKHKKDAPSGTALSLQRAIAPSGPGNIQTHSVRAGEIIGDHEATFHGPADRITIGHFANSRTIFARGAIETALWLATKRTSAQNPGTLISMETFFKERFL
jgi:4-hydroxy-tetrahydrodipicolinate reductase